MSMSPLKCLVGPATKEDIEDLVNLRSYLLDNDSNGSYVSQNQEDRIQWRVAYRLWLQDVLEDDDNIRILAAKCNREVIGCVTGIIDRRAPARGSISGYCGWIQSFVVAPRWRRHGIANQLMKNILDWFALRGISKVVLESTHEAQSFYEKNGFNRSPENLLIREDG